MQNDGICPKLDKLHIIKKLLEGREIIISLMLGWEERHVLQPFAERRTERSWHSSKEKEVKSWADMGLDIRMGRPQSSGTS